MFGDSMFEGGDVNATSMGDAGGAAPSFAQGSMNEAGGYMNASDQPMNEAGQPMDPAAQAFQSASVGADQSTAQANNAINISGAISHGAGLFTSIDNMIGKGRRVARNQRKYSRQMAQAGVDNANRALAQFQDDSASERAQLSQSYAGRGLGQSSIQTEGMQYYDNQTARKMATLQQNIQLAESGRRLVNSQISQSYVQPYIGFWNSIAGMV